MPSLAGRHGPGAEGTTIMMTVVYIIAVLTVLDMSGVAFRWATNKLSR